MALSDIVTVNISTQTTAPTRVGFGTPLIVGYHTRFAERARSYTTLAAMVTDGFATTDPEYLAATAVLSQNPKVGRFIVGRAANAPTMIEEIDMSGFVANSTAYSIILNAKAASFTSDASATAAEISAGLKLAIDALAEPVTVTDDLAGKLTITANAAGVMYTLETDRSVMTRANTTIDAGIAADITAIKNENDDWYGVTLTSQSKAEIVAAAGYIETVIKQLIVSSADDDILDSVATTDVASTLGSANYARTSIMFHEKPHQYAGAGWIGKVLPTNPGSATWKFKTIAGLTTSVLTDTEVATARAKSCNIYISESGVSHTGEGYASSGEFIDVTLFVDWLRARIQERIFALKINAAKIPFTDQGVAMIEAALLAQLQEGVDPPFGGLAADPAPVVIVPAVADISPADKAARRLTGVIFSATLSGAIHSTTITGTVSA